MCRDSDGVTYLKHFLLFFYSAYSSTPYYYFYLSRGSIEYNTKLIFITLVWQTVTLMIDRNIIKKYTCSLVSWARVLRLFMQYTVCTTHSPPIFCSPKLDSFCLSPCAVLIIKFLINIQRSYY